MSEDPWSDLATPAAAGTITARRVDDTNAWDFYWGRDTDRRCLLVLRHRPGSAPRDRLPRLKGVDVFIHPGTEHDSPSLVLRLLDSTLRDIFLRLSIDIIASAGRAASEAEAVATAVARTWRWHHLLRGGGTGLLTTEEQKGLIAELLFLERYLLPVLAPASAVAAWRGPLGASKDFVVGVVGIESKAIATSAAPAVHVNSEYQLDIGDLAGLFLHISVLDPSSDPNLEGFTLNDVADRIRKQLTGADGLSADRFDALLAAAGFGYDDDYSQMQWTGGERAVYRVDGAFPRLTATTLPPGIGNVTYLLSLATCAPFLVSPAVMTGALFGDGQ